MLETREKYVLCCTCVVHFGKLTHLAQQVFANAIWPRSEILTHISCFAAQSLTMRQPELVLVITSVSPVSTCCLMEACNIVLIFTLLFSIKGQTVLNSTVIPHTLCSHFTPVSFYTALPCNCTVFHIKVFNTGVASSTPLCITISLIFLIFFRSVNFTFTSVLFFPNQQIRKLRRELDASQEKVATLTSQLAANVSLFTSKDGVKTACSFAW